MKTGSLSGLPRDDQDRLGFFRQKKFWIPAAVLLLLVAGGLFVLPGLSQTEQAAESTAQIQTAVARRGDLTIFAAGTGEIVASSEISTGFEESGRLVEIPAAVGQRVEAGEVLARLQTDRSEEDIQLALAEAELAVLNAQQSLDEIYDSWQVQAAEALIAVEEAEAALAEVQNIELRQAEALQAIAEAESALRSAQSAYNGTRSTADENTIKAAYAELVLAESKLKDQKEKFKEYANKPDGNLQKANQQLKLSEAQAAYDSVLSYYNALTGTGSQIDLQKTEADLAVAQAQLAEAQAAYERIKDGATPGEIALAEAELATAQARYETLKEGPDPVEIALAEAGLASAKAQLAVVREEQAVIELSAPMDGTILAIDAAVGEEIGTGAFITLADLSRPILEVYLDESDLNHVAVGDAVEVAFDALPDKTYTGEVIEVNPSLMTVSNVDTLVARVRLAEDSFVGTNALPIGSNAATDVIGGKAENAVLVPVEAVREISPGQYAVFVVEDGEPRLRAVTVGLMDLTTAEITSGLEAGEVVTTGVVETTGQSGS